MNDENDLVKVALASEVPPRSMKHVDIDGKEIALVNIDGQFYAIEERCGHDERIKKSNQSVEDITSLKDL